MAPSRAALCASSGTEHVYYPEGPEGSGKTCQIRELAAYLQGLGFEVLTTREPGGTDIGDQIRQVLVRLENQGLHPRTEILLFLAALPTGRTGH